VETRTLEAARDSNALALGRYSGCVAGYVAAARVAHAEIRWGGTTRPEQDRPSGAPAAPIEVESLAGESLDERLTAWWADLREQWAITTFYLFDPQSWR